MLAVEVSEDTYESRGADALEAGFNVDFGETQELDMVGTITVE